MVPILKEFFCKAFRLGSETGPRLVTGSGSPETAVTAPVASLYLRDDGDANTVLYVKVSGTGNTGWLAIGGWSVGTTAPPNPIDGHRWFNTTLGAELTWLTSAWVETGNGVSLARYRRLRRLERNR